MKNRTLSVLALATALPIAGCGGDDGPTRDEFVNRADRLCASANREGTELAKRAFDDPRKPTAKEAQVFIRDAVPLQRDLVAELRQLERPDGDDAEIDALLTATEEGTDAIERAAETPEGALALLGADEDPFAEARRHAADYGMDDCAK